MSARRMLRVPVSGRGPVGAPTLADRLSPTSVLVTGLTAPRATFPGAQTGSIPGPTPWSSIDRRVRTRLRPTAVVLGTIVVLTMLGLVYLTQLLSADEARYQVDRLLVERQALQRTLASQEARIMQRGSEAYVVGWAQRDGLDRLDDIVRVRAR